MHYLGDEELKALENLFKSKKLFRYQVGGPSECDLFEKEFSSHIGVSYSLLLSSGTNALVAALLASDVGPGDEVLIPTYTFFATAAAVAQVGAVPVLVNIDSQLGIDPEEIKKKITPRTKAVIPVHMDGLAADMEAVLKVAESQNLAVIEDVAQAIGGSYKDKRLGSFGRFGCFSLNENKNISCGEGGILVTSDQDLYKKAFSIHDGAARFNPLKKDLFHLTSSVGLSMRVSEIQGAIMRVQLGRLEQILSELRERKNILIEYLSQTAQSQIIRGHCKSGDCGSSLHLQFENPDVAANAGRKLRENGIGFFPVTARPAHASWKWAHLMEIPNRTDILPSMDILSRTLKIDISVSLSLLETEKLALQVQEILR